ncbi:hypothetical protein GCM10027436_12550 [Actinophytocola sediminis]
MMFFRHVAQPTELLGQHLRAADHLPQGDLTDQRLEQHRGVATRDDLTPAVADHHPRLDIAFGQAARHRGGAGVLRGLQQAGDDHRRPFNDRRRRAFAFPRARELLGNAQHAHGEPVRLGRVAGEVEDTVPLLAHDSQHREERGDILDGGDTPESGVQ